MNNDVIFIFTPGGDRKHLGANVIVWGVVLMLQAVGTSFSAFFALRFILGEVPMILMCKANSIGIQGCVKAVWRHY